MKKKPSALSIVRHPGAFVRFLRDREAPLFPRLLALFAVLYVILPIDAIPDAIPILGWLDDLGVVALMLGWTSSQVKRYVPGGDKSPIEVTAELPPRTSEV